MGLRYFGPTCALASAAAALGQVTVVNLGVLPGGDWSSATGVTADGRVAVGRSSGSNGDRAFRWSALEGMADLGVLPGTTWSHAADVSDDGGVIVGTANGPVAGGYRAFRWTSGTGMVDLGLLPGAQAALALATNADGTVIVGHCAFASGAGRAFRWTAAEGMVDLGTGGEATDVNADGSVVVGWTSPEPGQTVTFIWSPAAPTRYLGVPSGGTFTRAGHVSADGSTVVGQFDPLGAPRGFRWSDGAGMQTLGTLAGAPASAGCTNADGSVVVGTCGGRAFYWTTSLGTLDLNAYVAALGGTLDGLTLASGRRITPNGHTVVGDGEYQGQARAWLVSGLPLPVCYPNCDSSTVAPILNVNDFLCFMIRYNIGEPYANCDRSTTQPVLTVNDFSCFLNRFAAGCL